MKAVYKYAEGAGNTHLTDRQEPEINEIDNVKIKVLACTLCGMDLQMYKGRFPYTSPMIIGHEFVGIVHEVAEGVTSVSVGDRVVAEPHLYACLECRECKNGYTQFCKDRRSLGLSRDGALAEYVVIPSKYLHVVPNEIPDELACLLEPMTILVGDVIVYPELKNGETVLITGAGQIALLAVVAAKAGGAGKIIVSGINNDEGLRFNVAKDLGADYTVNSQKYNLVEKVMEITNNDGVDLVIEASGSEVAINDAIKALRPGGRMSVLGGIKKDIAAINWDGCLKKALTLKFNMMSNYELMEHSIEIFKQNPEVLSKLVTIKDKIENWEVVIAELEKGENIKAVLKI